MLIVGDLKVMHFFLQNGFSLINVEFTGDGWDPIDHHVEELCKLEIPVFEFPYFCFSRTEVWTSLCYDVHWQIKLGRNANNFRHQQGQLLTSEQQRKKRNVIFLRQKFLSRIIGWNIMKRDISDRSSLHDIHKFDEWIKHNYPG